MTSVGCYRLLSEERTIHAAAERALRAHEAALPDDYRLDYQRDTERAWPQRGRPSEALIDARLGGDRLTELLVSVLYWAKVTGVDVALAPGPRRQHRAWRAKQVRKVRREEQ